MLYSHILRFSPMEYVKKFIYFGQSFPCFTQQMFREIHFQYLREIRLFQVWFAFNLILYKIFINFMERKCTWFACTLYTAAMKFFKMSIIKKKKYFEKNRVWHSHIFLLPYIIVEKYFINRITFIFNFYFICFVVDELPAFIFIVYNFLT